MLNDIFSTTGQTLPILFSEAPTHSGCSLNRPICRPILPKKCHNENLAAKTAHGHASQVSCLYEILVSLSKLFTMQHLSGLGSPRE